MLKCFFFHKWPIINCDVVGYKNVPCMYRLDKLIEVEGVEHFLYGVAVTEQIVLP